MSRDAERKGNIMEHTEIVERVVSIVKENLGNQKATIDNTLEDDLGADALDIVELTMSLEEEFGIEIPDEHAERFKTVKDIVTFIDNKMNING